MPAASPMAGRRASTRLGAVVLAASLAGWGGARLAEVALDVPPAPAVPFGPEEHPEALRQGGRIQPSEAPIVETWEDEHFPFLGFAPEVAGTAEIVHGAPPPAPRPHPLDAMVLVPAGPVIVGDDAVPGSRPRRTVTVPGFWIDRYEVSNGLYRRFVVATGRRAPYVHENWAAVYSWGRDTPPAGLEEVPVVLVTWHDADAYCRWAGKRLPSEVEWEAAARGPDGRPYPWGAVWDSRKANVVSRLSGPLRTVAEWDAFERQWTGSKKPEIFPVGSYPEDRSPYGVMDMAGNVSEWVADTFGPYPGAPPTDRPGFGRGLRVARGNSWGNRDYSTPLAIRYPYEADRVDSVIGFRCARDAR